MSKTNTLENDYLVFFFIGTAIPNLPAAGGNFYIALFTADPGETGSMAAEATYTGYGRQAVLRQGTGNGWAVSGTAPTVCTNLAQINYAACTGGSNTITHFGICSSATFQAGTMWYKGALSASLAVSNGITPQIAAGALSIQED